jgi:hypothetical protein
MQKRARSLANPPHSREGPHPLHIPEASEFPQVSAEHVEQPPRSSSRSRRRIRTRATSWCIFASSADLPGCRPAASIAPLLFLQMAKKGRTVSDSLTPTSALCPLPELGGGPNRDVSEDDEDPLQAFLANFDLPDCTLFDTGPDSQPDCGLLGPSALDNLCF